MSIIEADDRLVADFLCTQKGDRVAQEKPKGKAADDRAAQEKQQMTEWPRKSYRVPSEVLPRALTQPTHLFTVSQVQCMTVCLPMEQPTGGQARHPASPVHFIKRSQIWW